MDTREVETGVPNRRSSPKFVVTNGTNYNGNDAVKTNKNKNRVRFQFDLSCSAHQCWCSDDLPVSNLTLQ